MPTSETLEWRIGELRDRLREERLEEARLSRALTDAYESGEGDPSAIAGERGLATGRREGLEAAIADLEKQVQEMRRQELTARATDAMASAKKRVGGLAGEHPRNIQRAHELIDQLRSVLEKVVSASIRQSWEAESIAILSQRFGIGEPHLKLLPKASIDPGIDGLKDALRNVIPESGRGPAFGPGRSLSFRARETAVALERYGVESPVESIVTEAGPTEAEVQAGLDREEKKASREAQEALHMGSIESDLARARAGSRSGI